jgi:S-adenosylmethionine synthetase
MTAESVTEGHPDKVADKVSDEILDACLIQDPGSRVACETFITKNYVLVAGEITSKAEVDFKRLVRKTILDIGYDRPEEGFSFDTCKVEVRIHHQSKDISQSVNVGGAGDQGVMYGYACRETDQLMPLPISVANALTSRLSFVRKDGSVPWLRPDGKALVTINYENGSPTKVDTVLLSAQHEEGVKELILRETLTEEVLQPVLRTFGLDTPDTILINPGGRFVAGGPAADTGLTGRKIMVDSYGSAVPHGGGSFSGKDPTKVDRSGAYMARHIAKSIVNSELVDRVLVGLSYAIGKAEPLSIYVYTFNVRQDFFDDGLALFVQKHFPLNQQSITEYLKLREPVYSRTAAYGHFGRTDFEFQWEKTADLTEYLYWYVPSATENIVKAKRWKQR